MPNTTSSTLRKTTTYLAIITGLGLAGFIGGGVATAAPAVAAACEDETCNGQDCQIKDGHDCDEEPLCTSTPCPVE